MKKLISSGIVIAAAISATNVANAAESNCFDYYCINVGAERYVSQPNFNLEERRVDLDDGVGASISLSVPTQLRSVLGGNRVILNTRLSAGNVDAVTSSLANPLTEEVIELDYYGLSFDLLNYYAVSPRFSFGVGPTLDARQLSTDDKSIEDTRYSGGLTTALNVFLSKNVTLQASTTSLIDFDSGDDHYVLGLGLGYRFGGSNQIDLARAIQAPVVNTINEPAQVAPILTTKPILNEVAPVLQQPVKEKSAPVFSIVDLGINFDTNSSIISSYDLVKVTEFVEKYKEYAASDSSAVIELQGHTDSSGSDQYNQWLSDRRAKSAAALINSAYGINFSKITAIGKGEKELIKNSLGLEDMAESRRTTGLIRLDSSN